MQLCSCMAALLLCGEQAVQGRKPLHVACVPVHAGAAQGTGTSAACHVCMHGPKQRASDELCTLLVEPTFLGHVSEHTFVSADMEMARFVCCACG